MAPIRRYLRITKFSVLEVRIYLHKPSDASWLLSSRDNVLTRIIQEVRPKVLPKLREENANSKQQKPKGKKKRGIKDVASQDDFEVSIFLKETTSRHSLLTKKKEFSSKPKLRSNGKGLTGWLGAGGGDKKEDAIDLDEGNEVPEILREEEQDEVVDLSGILEVGGEERSIRKRKSAEVEEGRGEGQDEDEALFVSSSDEEFFATQRAQPSKKRRKRNEKEEEEAEQVNEDEDDELDDKKKMTLDTNYDGFSIYGRILCLIVTRKGKKEPQARALDDAAPAGGSQMMERFIATQVAREEGLSDVEDG
ncbi:hypothetical protein Slin15195_G020730 [Septoria linicola]|uniref:Uncharacterized protein n=1 Tax=Septoria linicola TaxID=215465 RepID=A0A9Q9AG06_9PEZI|nr:hypothetical protein Slin15195_G020730 [Septoria linicola]